MFRFRQFLFYDLNEGWFCSTYLFYFFILSWFFHHSLYHATAYQCWSTVSLFLTMLLYCRSRTVHGPFFNLDVTMKQSQYLGARRCMKQNICNVYEHKVGGASTNCEACPRCGKHELEGATTLNNVHDVEKTNNFSTSKIILNN